MYALLFPVTVVLVCSRAGRASEDSGSAKIQAFVGETVILPCNINVSDDLPTVEWSKEGLDQGVAFVYRNFYEIPEMKHEVFRYRTNLFMNEVQHGNISLRISDVQLSDAGKYKCKTIRKKAQEVVDMELVVGAVSQPNLTVVPVEGGGWILQCEAKCWFPEPEITFLDSLGNTISAENQKTNPDTGGCFTATRRLTPQTSRIICRVHQPETNQTRTTEIYIPDDCMRSCTSNTIITVIITIIVTVAVGVAVGVAVVTFGCKKYLPVERQKSPVSSQSSLQAEADSEDYSNLNVSTESLMDKDEPTSSRHHCHWQPTIDNSPSESLLNVSHPLNTPPQLFPHDDNPKPVASTSGNHPNSDNLPQNKDSKPDFAIQNPAPGPLIQRSSHDRTQSGPRIRKSRSDQECN